MDDTTLITILNLLVPFIFILRLHKMLLINKPFNLITKLVFVILAIAGFYQSFQHSFDRASTAMFIAFASPIYHYLLFIKSYNYFVNRIGREPKNVAYNFEKGLFYDRVYTISFYLFAFFSSMFLEGIFLWNINNIK